MKKMLNFKYVIVGFLLVLCGACSDFLDLEPKNKIPGESVLSDPNGIKSFLADLDYGSPIEDFVYMPAAGFNARGNTGSLTLAQYALEAIHSEWPNWNQFANDWWNKGYFLNRNINLLMTYIPNLDISVEEKDALMGEAHFLRAYTYFGLAKRYGGVSIITKYQEFEPNTDNLKVPRSTEKETWDFVMEECDRAIRLLPETRNNPSEEKRRATKWTAYALKSRAALHAASVAKYWDKAPLEGEAVDKNFVGLDKSDASRYYQACIDASKAIIASNRFGLYKAHPGSVQEAIANYRALFTDPNVAGEEAIFIKGYGAPGTRIAHDYDAWNNPNQNAEGFPHRGRTNPILELIDLYEDYTNPGHAAPIITTEDGKVSDNEGYRPYVAYRHFDSPEEIFKHKDARFFACITYPNSVWKGKKIVIQGGVIKPNGDLMSSPGACEHNGKTYYTFGAQFSKDYSGFDGTPNCTRTGFLMRKFLNENLTVTKELQSTTDFMDFRYAEILLNFAEAVVEKGETDGNLLDMAKKGLNDLRKRAAHTTEVDLTLDNVLRERRIELAFENKGYWDLIRRRDFHSEFDNRRKMALVPMIDLRGEKPQYIFVRKFVSGANSCTFQTHHYYRHIPGTSTNGLTQNPKH